MTLHGREQAAIVAAAEKKFADYKREQGLEQLEQIKKRYAGLTPKTEPRQAGRVKTAKGWQGTSLEITGKVEIISDPQEIARLINNDLKANYRRRAGGKSEAKNKLSLLLGDLKRQREDLERQEATAAALLCAMEESDAEPLKDLTWHKIQDPFKAGVLPRLIDGDRYLENTAWPPKSKEERERAAKRFPGYQEWLELPDTVQAPFEPENGAGYYLLEDPFRVKHNAILRETVLRGEATNSEDLWRIIEQDASLLEQAL